MSREMVKKVIIYRAGQTGRMVYYDSLNHPTFKIACFAMEEKYLTAESELFGIPIVSDKEVKEMYPPNNYDMLIADERYENMRTDGEISQHETFGLSFNKLDQHPSQSGTRYRDGRK